MSSYLGYTGQMNISDEKKEEFNARVMKILTQGGMMGYENIKINDKTLTLLSPLKPNTDGKIIIDYNYFEDDVWETAVYDTATCHLSTQKVGRAEFADVLTAAYQLYPAYDLSPGFVYDGASNNPLSPESIIEIQAWHKHLFNLQIPGKAIGTSRFLDAQDDAIRFWWQADISKNPHISDDDCLLFWLADKSQNAVHISDYITKWLLYLRWEYKKLIDSDFVPIPHKDFLDYFVNILDKANQMYWRVYLQQDTYYDILMHASDRRYQALIHILDKLTEECKKLSWVSLDGDKHFQSSWHLLPRTITQNPARKEIKRYLALISNPELRRKIFDF